MNSDIYIYIYMLCFLSLIVLLLLNNKKEKRAIIRKISKRNIYTFDSQIAGIVKEVSDGAMLIENNQNTEVINLDFVVRIREYPKDKKGKRKSVVLD